MNYKGKWQTIEFNGGSMRRKLYVDDATNPKYKYNEEITFVDVTDDRPYAICIGLNPAAAEEKLDVTNQRLVKLLNQEYKGYFLFNIYPEITDNKKQLNFDDNENIGFVSILKNILNEEQYSHLDVILFFGRTLVIPKDFVDLLQEWHKNRRIYITSHKEEFTHPGANADIQKISFEINYLKNSTSIRVNPS